MTTFAKLLLSRADNPEAAARRVRGGRYWSGDLGYRDENGFF